MCFCETFLTDTFCDYENSLDNYLLFRRDRSFSGGGGFVIYLKAVDLFLNPVH